MSQIAKKVEVVTAFEMLVKAIGGRIAESPGDVGGYRLDHSREYGGYNIELVVNETDGVSHPFGLQRRHASQMCDVLYFARLVQEGK